MIRARNGGRVGSRECKLLEDIVQAFKDVNLAAFTDALVNYDSVSCGTTRGASLPPCRCPVPLPLQDSCRSQISKFDPWQTHVLIAVRNHIQRAGGHERGGEIDLT
jgi:hypothetical protein